MDNYDLIVIGGGPGGYEAALEAARSGLKTLLAEENQIGGVCLNRGCIPTKSLIKQSSFYAEAISKMNGKPLPEELKPDLAAMMAKAEEGKTTLRNGVGFLLKKAGVTVVEGHAYVNANRTVKIGDTLYEAKNILLVSGSRPAKLNVPGSDLEGVFTSDDLLSGTGISCSSLAIVGGGVIAAEFARVYHAMGTEVTILEALPRILPKLSREIGQSLEQSFKKKGMKIFTEAFLQRIEKEEEHLVLHFTRRGAEQSVQADAVLLCTGRTPNTENLYDPALGIEASRGYLLTDPDGRTSAEGIYAAGDIVAGSPQLAHSAVYQGKRAVRAILGKKTVDAVIPSCVFTEPEIACAGLDPDQAKEKGIAVVTKKALTSANGRSVVEGAERGFARLVFEAESHKLFGAQLMCSHASEMIGGLAVMIQNGITAEQMAECVWPHPTVSEILAMEYDEFR